MCLYLAYTALGMVSGMSGPTILDLQLTVGTTFDQITYVIPSRSVGYAMGSLFVGFVFAYLNVQALIAMYRPHMAREATDVFPALRALVNAEEYDELADEMAKRTRQALGADGPEKITKQVAEVERVIGIQDLSVFTPKS